MATREVNLPLATAHDDNHCGAHIENNNWTVYQYTAVGPHEAKGVEDQDSYHRFTPAIPKGSLLTRSKVTQIVDGGPYLEAQLPLLAVGILEPDDWWDWAGGTVGQKTYQDEIHFTSQMREPDDTQIFSTSLAAYGVDVLFRPSPTGATDYDCGSFGMKFKASATQTLGNVIARIYREAGTRPTTTLYCKVYSPVSASDPRPGSLLATSQGVAFDDLPTTLPGGTPPTGWPEWEFIGGNQIEITNGQEYVYTIEVDGPYGTHPLLYWRFDDDRGGEPAMKQGNLPVEDVWAIWNEESVLAFGFGNYANHDLMPSALFAGTGFTTGFKPVTGKDLDDFDTNTWGDDGYNCDATIGLKSILQAFIDDPGYDEAGTKLAVYVWCADKEVGAEIRYQAQHWAPGYDGMVLTIEYTEPVPSKATNPRPADWTDEVAVDVVLSWVAGAYAGTAAVTHKVYFGTDPDPSGNYIGEQPGTTYDPPGDLVNGTEYFWRIDEVGEFETTVGDVWQFTVGTYNTGFLDGETEVQPALTKKTGRVLPAVRGQVSVVPVKLAAELDLRPAVEAKVRVELIAGSGAGAGARLGADARVRACAEKDRGRVRPAVEGSTRVVPVKLAAELCALPAVSGREAVVPAVSGDPRVRGGKRPKGRGES